MGMSRVLPILVEGTITGTEDNDQPTFVSSRANLTPVVIVNEDPIPVNLISTAVTSKVQASVSLAGLSTGSNTISYDTEAFDDDGWHSTSVDSEIFTVPSDKGTVYLILAELEIGNTPTTDADALMSLQLDTGSGFSTIAQSKLFAQPILGALAVIAGQVSAIRDLSEGDRLRLLVEYEAGGTVSAGSSTFSVVSV